MGDSEEYRELRNRADGIIYVVNVGIAEAGDRIPPDAQMRLRALVANVQLVVDIQGEAPWLRRAIGLLEKEVDRINRRFR